ncbi:MAG TPA: hypothetical protein VFK13_00305 [Gemmatimonadaceae bacterium]|nr:hypothetical protein [Gemmatimonadaceae bacterium]
MIGLLAFCLLQVPAPQPPARVQMGVGVSRDTVTVGDHFLVTVRVRTPLGARVVFPPAPDTGGAIEAADPRRVEVVADSLFHEERALYGLAAWDTGAVSTTLGDVVIENGGVEERAPVGPIRVYVRSVLPADTALRVPKPARDILPWTRPWWQWAVAALVAAAIIGVLLWWWLRRRRRRGAEPLVADPFAWATEAFARIDALRLLEAGEGGRYAALSADVLREYLARRTGIARRSMTSAELLGALAGREEIPQIRLTALLGETDLVKFARLPLSVTRARELGAEARTLVRAVQAGIDAAAQRAAAEAARAASTERAA